VRNETLPGVHLHNLSALQPTLGGMACRECGNQWSMPDGTAALLIALKAAIDDLEERTTKQAAALISLGLAPCEECSGWFKPKTAAGFDGKYGSACVRCLPEWFGQTTDFGQREVDKTVRQIVSWFTPRADEIKAADTRTHYWIERTFRVELAARRRAATNGGAGAAPSSNQPRVTGGNP
jgi:hypothetical protein